MSFPESARPPRVWGFMHALGEPGLPPTIDVAGKGYTLHEAVKHDFFAATGFYADADGQLVVAKFGRSVSFLGLPMRWLGRLTTWQELHYYERLADVPNVPNVLGRVEPVGFVHVYIPGRPVDRDVPLPAGFFDELLTLLAELHRRGIAYVDTNKPQNILLGDDGRPYLIDFQISFDATVVQRIPLVAGLARWWLGVLSRADRYHVLKHKKRLAPAAMTPAELAEAEKRGWAIRTHRAITRPWFATRRRLFGWLRRTGRLLPEGSK